MKILETNILVKQYDDERNCSNSGLVYNAGGNMYKKPELGEVVCISDFVKDIKIGDKVFFSKYAGVRMQVEGEDLLLLSRNEIFGINNHGVKIEMGETKDLLGIMENIGQLVERDFSCANV